MFCRPFPVEQAKRLRLYKIKVEGKKVEEELTPYEFAKGLRKSYLERIEGIYKIFGGTFLSLKFQLAQMLHGELAEIKCRPLPLRKDRKDSWKDTIEAWSKDQNWGGRISGIERSVLQFLDTYIFSPFLDLSDKKPSEKKYFFVVKPEKFKIKITKFAKRLSFKAYIVEKTIQEFFKYLFEDPDPQDLAEIKAAFSEEMQNEKRRNTFIYFFTNTVRSYKTLKKNIAQFGYPSYQKALKAQFKDLKHLIFKYKSKEKKGKKYILSKTKEKFYDLLFSYLMAIYVFEVFPTASLSDRRRLFKGIWRMESSERLALYNFLCCQVRKPIEERQQSILYVFSKLPFLKRYPISITPKEEIDEFLKKYSFSETEKTRIEIQSLFFHRGLMTKMTEADDQGFQPIDFAFCVKLILNIQEICGFQLPANIVSYILTWSYLNKKGTKEIKHLKDRLGEAKTEARRLILKDKDFFFISPQNRQYINEVISRVIPKSTFIPKNEAKEALCNCLQYTIYPHIAPSDFYPFIFLAFELSDGRFNRLKGWGRAHLGMFQELEPYQSALRIDTCWKEIASEEYFQFHLTYFPSSHEPRSFHMEETLRIPRERLRLDWLLCQILRIFSIFLADEFEPIKTGYLKSAEQRKYEEKGKGKKKVEGPETPGYREIRSFEDALSCFDNPIFSYLWNIYEEDDKNELGEMIYEFFFRIKTSIRKKMDGMFFPQQHFPVEEDITKNALGGTISLIPHPEDIMKNALEGTIYPDAHHISLIPLNLLDDFPQYGVKKEDYSTKMSVILESVQKNLNFTWKNFFVINMGTGELRIDVKYRFSIVTHCDYHQQHTLELQSILDKRALIEGDSAPPDIASILSRLETSEEFDENLIQTEKHEIIFSCHEKKIDFSMAYPKLPPEEILLGQIVMLKWKCFKAFYDREDLI